MMEEQRRSDPPKCGIRIDNREYTGANAHEVVKAMRADSQLTSATDRESLGNYIAAVACNMRKMNRCEVTLTGRDVDDASALLSGIVRANLGEALSPLLGQTTAAEQAVSAKQGGEA